MDKKDLLIEAGIDFKELTNGGVMIDVGALSSEKFSVLKNIFELHENDVSETGG